MAGISIAAEIDCSYHTDLQKSQLDLEKKQAVIATMTGHYAKTFSVEEAFDNIDDNIGISFQRSWMPQQWSISSRSVWRNGFGEAEAMN